jgi:hypothetical protein
MLKNLFLRSIRALALLINEKNKRSVPVSYRLSSMNRELRFKKLAPRVSGVHCRATCSQYLRPTSYFRYQRLRPITLWSLSCPEITVAVRQDREPISSRVECRKKPSSITDPRKPDSHFHRGVSLTPTNPQVLRLATVSSFHPEHRTGCAS